MGVFRTRESAHGTPWKKRKPSRNMKYTPGLYLPIHLAGALRKKIRKRDDVDAPVSKVQRRRYRCRAITPLPGHDVTGRGGRVGVVDARTLSTLRINQAKGARVMRATRDKGTSMHEGGESDEPSSQIKPAAHAEPPPPPSPLLFAAPHFLTHPVETALILRGPINPASQRVVVKIGSGRERESRVGGDVPLC